MSSLSSLSSSSPFSSSSSSTLKPILFYNKNEPFYEFSNFWGFKNDKQFKLIIDDKEWLTTEHYYQANKFTPINIKKNNEYYELIRTATTPAKAFMLANQKPKKYSYYIDWKHSKNNQSTLNDLIEKYKDITVFRNDWDIYRDKVMLKAVTEKFKQNEHLRKLLLNTNNSKIIEHTKRDKYWGDGGDGKGQNKLGLILMEVREKLKKKHSLSLKRNTKNY